MSMALKASKGQVYGSGIAGGPLSGAAAGQYGRRAYMGDPGLFGFLGKAVGTVAKVAGKILPGPVGIAAGTVGGLLAGGSKSTAVTRVPNTLTIAPQQIPQLPVPGVQGAIQRALPGGQTGYMPAGPSPSGYHWNKTSYFLRDGTFVPEGSKLVKNRRRNPLNPRAASRAISRLESAKKATKRLDRVAIKCRRCGYASCRCK